MKEGLIGILKFFLFLLILPLAIAVIVAFQEHAAVLPILKQRWLFFGAGAFLVSYLFLYNFNEVFAFGQSVVAKLFGFLGPLSAGVGLVLPIYAILLTCLYLVLNVVGLTATYDRYLLAALGFSMAMHTVLAARQLYDADSHPIKSHYLCVFVFVLLFTLAISAGLLAIISPEFSFVSFVKAFGGHTAAYYKEIYRVLFVPS